MLTDCTDSPPTTTLRSHKISYPILNIQCQGMHAAPVVANTTAKCEAVCCADPKCNTWLFNVGDVSVKGYCWIDDGVCSGPSVQGWVGASTSVPPAPPPPPPPTPPPPPPNGLRELLYATDTSCGSGRTTPATTMLLGQCYELLPFPSDPAHDKTASVMVSPTDGHGVTGSSFTLARFSTTTCAPTSSLPSESITLGVCHNQSVPAGTGVMAWSWVRAYVPP
jgi:hypothetical protein